MKRPTAASPPSVTMVSEAAEPPSTCRRTESGHSFESAKPRMQTRRNHRKVLLLGMSYPHIEEQMEEEGYSLDILDTRKLGIDLIVELVRRRILTEMDGRDYARILAMQEQHGVQAYTVSQEQGSLYWNERHLEANFCRHNFVKGGLQRSFGEEVKFHQIVLDYFWIPKGIWMAHHWKGSFFRSTLIDLLDVLHDEGTIWLPFCYHCCKELVANLDVISKRYSISFAQRHELEGNLLWSGTQGIDPIVMQEDLGKRIDQEEIYCTFGPSDVSQAMEDSRVRKSDVVGILRRIEDFETVRFIVLRPGKGGFVNLPPAEKIVNGYDSLMGAYKADDTSNFTATTADMTEEEESAEEEEEPEMESEKEEEMELKSKDKSKLKSKDRFKLKSDQKFDKLESNDSLNDRSLPPTVYMIARDLKTYNKLHRRNSFLNTVYGVNAIRRAWDVSAIMRMVLKKECDPEEVVDHWGLTCPVPLTYNAIYESRRSYEYDANKTYPREDENDTPWMNQYPRLEPVDRRAVASAVRREVELDKKRKGQIKRMLKLGGLTGTVEPENQRFERPTMLPESPSRKKARRMRMLSERDKEDENGWVYYDEGLRE